MKFKTLFFSLCMLFVSAVSFAATNDTISFNDEDPLTLKAANEAVAKVMASADVAPEFEFLKVTAIAVDDASCTVTGSLGVGGSGITVSATAETCAEALQMVLDVIQR
jgi:hypothetical protein